MANHKSAVKKSRQDEARRLRNRVHRSRMRTAVKRLRRAIEDEDAEGARGLLSGALSLVDRTAKAGVIHDNVAARTKARLTRAVAKIAAAD